MMMRNQLLHDKIILCVCRLSPLILLPLNNNDTDWAWTKRKKRGKLTVMIKSWNSVLLFHRSARRLTFSALVCGLFVYALCTWNHMNIQIRSCVSGLWRPPRWSFYGLCCGLVLLKCEENCLQVGHPRGASSLCLHSLSHILRHASSSSPNCFWFFLPKLLLKSKIMFRNLLSLNPVGLFISERCIWSHYVAYHMGISRIALKFPWEIFARSRGHTLSKERDTSGAHLLFIIPCSSTRSAPPFSQKSDCTFQLRSAQREVNYLLQNLNGFGTTISQFYSIMIFSLSTEVLCLSPFTTLIWKT